MRILITGGNGQLGRALQRVLAGHDLTAVAHGDLDVSDAARVAEVIAGAAPDAVLHCAALTDTARCEHEPALANAVNARGTGYVAQASRKADAMFVAVSTNEVFDGGANEPYAEDAATNPLNVYGRSKVEGERLAAAAHEGAMIVRTSWVYGDGGANFVEKVRAAAIAGRPLRFVDDETAAPTAAADLAEGIRALVEARAPAGVYHLANEGAASRYEWACEILRLAGFDVTPIDRVTTAELRAAGYDGPVKPPYSVLANTRARALGIVLPAWRDALAAHIERSKVAADG